MINIKKFNLLGLTLAFSLMVSPVVNANEYGISEERYSAIEDRVNAMSVAELASRSKELSLERDELKCVQSNEVSSSNIASRLNAIAAELH